MFTALKRKATRVFAPPDVAIDLGTAHTRVKSSSGSIAEELTRIPEPRWRGSHPASLCPMRRGLVQDADAVSAILEPMIRRAIRGWIVRPRALACLPSSAGEAEREMFQRVAHNSGARSVVFAPEPLAAAIGSGVDIASPWAQILVDVGEGVTDLAIIRGGVPVHTATLDYACLDMRERLAREIGATMHVELEDREAERLLRLACSLSGEAACTTSWLSEGRDPITGRMAAICVDSSAVISAIEPVIDEIAAFVRDVVNGLPPVIAVEIIENGMWLTGGGATLVRLATRLRQVTRLDVHRPADPLRAVITGAGRMLSVADASSLWVS